MSSQTMGEAALLEPVRALGIAPDEVEFVPFINRELPTASRDELLEFSLPEGASTGGPDALTYASRILPGVQLDVLSSTGSFGVVLEQQEARLALKIARVGGMPTRRHDEARTVAFLAGIGLGPNLRVFIDAGDLNKLEPDYSYSQKTKFPEVPIPIVRSKGELPIMVTDLVDYIDLHELRDEELKDILSFALVSALDSSISMFDGELGVDSKRKPQLIDVDLLYRLKNGDITPYVIPDEMDGDQARIAQIASGFMDALNGRYFAQHGRYLIQPSEYTQVGIVSELIGSGSPGEQMDVINYVLESVRQAKDGNTVGIRDFIETCLRPRRLPVVISPGGIAVARVVELPATPYVDFEISHDPQNPCRRPRTSNHPFNW